MVPSSSWVSFLSGNEALWPHTFLRFYYPVGGRGTRGNEWMLILNRRPSPLPSLLAQQLIASGTFLVLGTFLTASGVRG